MAASWRLAPQVTRKANEVSWFPIVEVAKFFAGIFITIIPAIAILRGRAGERHVLLGHPHPVELPRQRPDLPRVLQHRRRAEPLTGPLSTTLLAISAGAVFMWANTYIDNAPIFMVRAIAEERGVPMPSFLGYMLWSSLILLPIFAASSWLFFT